MNFYHWLFDGLIDLLSFFYINNLIFHIFIFFLMNFLDLFSRPAVPKTASLSKSPGYIFKHADSGTKPIEVLSNSDKQPGLTDTGLYHYWTSPVTNSRMYYNSPVPFWVSYSLFMA